MAEDRTGEKNWQYKDGRTRAVEELRKQTKCTRCSANLDGRVEVHHEDGDRENNSPENLEALCVSCHKKVHYREMGRNRKGDVGGKEAKRPWNKGLSQETDERVKRQADWKRGRKREPGTRNWLPRE